MTETVQQVLAKIHPLHTKAMEFYSRAVAAQFDGADDARLANLRSAFELERQAADEAHIRNIPEPSRSLYHRGAAALAIDVGENAEAVRLIRQARQGSPPAFVEAELEEMSARISTRSRGPKFELKVTPKKQYVFSLKAGNGEVILTSERYPTKSAALSGIRSVQSNSTDDALYLVKSAKNGLAYFVLIAQSKHVLGRSELYKSPSGCKRGMAAVKRNAVAAGVEDRTVLTRSA